jgi:hypothetical protein
MADSFRWTIVRGAEQFFEVTYPADLSGRNFRMPFRFPGASEDVAELTEGSGLTLDFSTPGETKITVLIPATITALFTKPNVAFSLWATDPLDESTRVDVIIGQFAVTWTPQ